MTIKVTFPLSISKEKIVRIIEGNLLRNAGLRVRVVFQGIDNQENLFYITAKTPEAFYQIGITAALILESHSNKNKGAETTTEIKP